jgi:hypothetical protein
MQIHQFMHKQVFSFATLADTPIHAQTGLFICHPCQLPWHPLLAGLGWLFGSGRGSGAVAPSAAAGWSLPENWTHRRMWKKAAELCGEKAFDDLGLGTSAGISGLGYS